MSKFHVDCKIELLLLFWQSEALYRIPKFDGDLINHRISIWLLPKVIIFLFFQMTYLAWRMGILVLNLDTIVGSGEKLGSQSTKNMVYNHYALSEESLKHPWKLLDQEKNHQSRCQGRVIILSRSILKNVLIF